MSKGAPPRGLRRIERWLVGLAMAVVAFVLEKAVVRGLKKRGEAVRTEPEATTITSRGGSVDAP